MISSRPAIFAAIALFFVGQTLAVPMPMSMRRAMEAREPVLPFEVIPAYIKRADINSMPAEVPTKGVNGDIVAYRKRVNGDIVAYRKRADINSMPAEVPTKGVNGDIVAYRKRADINSMPAEVPTKGVNGEIVAY
ncbi:hypothetical protein NEOLEDRAFT_1144205 [Neolentinus lepideus HHB14362 ss-1]|uniref:Uncharacterized protein n=1 Tax=Neolentinus lepideus HHB14362 ss-1 TaxID=1314782 RepID=A0A165W2X4_9AGAM|nr:hypothetical protein NEOLEDRAFT_1144205 [Neolentinus lepideus HHB14362 ss-1]